MAIQFRQDDTINSLEYIQTMRRSGTRCAMSGLISQS